MNVPGFSWGRGKNSFSCPCPEQRQPFLDGGGVLSGKNGRMLPFSWTHAPFFTSPGLTCRTCLIAQHPACVFTGSPVPDAQGVTRAILILDSAGAPSKHAAGHLSFMFSISSPLKAEDKININDVLLI